MLEGCARRTAAGCPDPSEVEHRRGRRDLLDPGRAGDELGPVDEHRPLELPLLDARRADETLAACLYEPIKRALGRGRPPAKMYASLLDGGSSIISMSIAIWMRKTTLT